MSPEHDDISGCKPGRSRDSETCSGVPLGPGDPAEAAKWVDYAEANGGHVSHVTVGQ
jgi:hypothetical protein